ncbi:MAG: hypothetical protein V5783_02465 [Pontiella sp.]
MKSLKYLAVFGALALLSGCATSSKVQEMIDMSYHAQTDRLDAHDASIDELKTSSVTSLKEGDEHAELLVQLQAHLDVLSKQVKTNKGTSEASKVMSAGNTVKAAELEELLTANTALDAETKTRMVEIDTLYEDVMISHFQMISDSAKQAIDDLKAEGWIGSSNAPVRIDEPFAIVAPPVAPATNAVPVE